MHLGRHWKVPQVLEVLLSVWKTWKESQAPGFDLAQLWLFHHLGSKQTNGRSLSLCFSLSLYNYFIQINKQIFFKYMLLGHLHHLIRSNKIQWRKQISRLSSSLGDVGWLTLSMLTEQLSANTCKQCLLLTSMSLSLNTTQRIWTVKNSTSILTKSWKWGIPNHFRMQKWYLRGQNTDLSWQI